MKAKLFDKNMVLVRDIPNFTLGMPDEFGVYEYDNDKKMIPNQEIVLNANGQTVRKFKITFYALLKVEDGTLIYQQGRKGKIGVGQYNLGGTSDKKIQD